MRLECERPGFKRRRCGAPDLAPPALIGSRSGRQQSHRLNLAAPAGKIDPGNRIKRSRRQPPATRPARRHALASASISMSVAVVSTISGKTSPGTFSGIQ